MKSSKDVFKNSLDKAYSTIKLNTSTMGDHMKYKQGFTEEKLKGGLADGMSLGDIAVKHKIDVEKLAINHFKTSNELFGKSQQEQDFAEIG